MNYTNDDYINNKKKRTSRFAIKQRKKTKNSQKNKHMIIEFFHGIQINHNICLYITRRKKSSIDTLGTFINR